MNERKFMSNLKKSFLEAGYWSTTLIDGSDYSPRPFDNITCINGKLVAIEGKFQKDFGAFGMRHIRDSQILNLDAVRLSGGQAYIFLNIWIPRAENRLLIWEWEYFKALTSEGSLKKRQLLDHPFVPGKKGTFPIPEVLSKMGLTLNTP
jgi:hypothetical protein